MSTKTKRPRRIYDGEGRCVSPQPIGLAAVDAIIEDSAKMICDVAAGVDAMDLELYVAWGLKLALVEERVQRRLNKMAAEEAKAAKTTTARRARAKGKVR